MNIQQYWIHSIEDDPIKGPFDTKREAMDEAGDDEAVILYEFEYSDSSLVDDRFDVWPPQ